MNLVRKIAQAVSGELVTRSAGWLIAVIAIVCVVIGAVLAVVLVALTRKEDRVDAIRATAGLLASLLPWRVLSRDPRRARRLGPGSRPSRRQR
jgi:hypothetical protein